MQKRNPTNRRFCQWDSSLHRMSSRFSFRLVFKKFSSDRKEQFRRCKFAREYDRQTQRERIQAHGRSKNRAGFHRCQLSQWECRVEWYFAHRV